MKEDDPTLRVTYLSALDLRNGAQRLDYIASRIAGGSRPEGAPEIDADTLRDWARTLRGLIPRAMRAEEEGAPGVPYQQEEFFELGFDLKDLEAVVRADTRRRRETGEFERRELLSADELDAMSEISPPPAKG
ncbi:MAG: hypothetical protein AAFU77_14190 [Myxococcota bacterium]